MRSPIQSTKYADIRAQALRMLPSFKTTVVQVPYEEKGILNSEMLFLCTCLPEDFRGRVLESGRARGQSTLILSLMFPQSPVLSIEFNKESPDVPVAAERLKGRSNVTLLFGDATKRLPEMLQKGDAVLIDGPKMFLAVRLALRLLATGKPVAVFMHDMNIGTAERAFLDRFMPETLFSDARILAEVTSPLDESAVAKNSPHTRLDGFTGDFGYGFSLACIPYVPGRAYRLLLALSYLYDALSRVLRRLRTQR